MSASSASTPPDHSRRRWLSSAVALPALSLMGQVSSAQTTAGTAQAAGAAGPAWPAWSMPGVHSFDLPAAHLPGSQAPRLHRVMVYVPQGPAPAAGWPVVYVLDGNLMFSMVAQLVHNRSARGGDLRSASAIVVGLGHVLPEGSTEVHDRAARTYDYTLPYDGVGPDGQGRAQGGADVFLDWISQQLQPQLQATLAMNMQQQTLVGHSYGGLCTLHALLTRPGMFQRHVAASPSLWWGGGVVLRECQAFIGRYRDHALPTALQLYLSQGSEELASRSSASRQPNPEREAAARAAQQLGSTADLPAMLAAVQGLSCHYQVWPGANHGGTQLYACMQAAQVGLAA